MSRSSQDDPDYVPDSETETDSEGIYTDEDDDEQQHKQESEEEKVIFYITAPPQVPRYMLSSMTGVPPPPKRQKFEDTLSKEESEYYHSLTDEAKQEIICRDQSVRESAIEKSVPLRFKILQSNLDANTKRIIINKLDHVQKMNPSSSEYFKMRNWINAATRLPLGKYSKLPVSTNDPVPKIAEFLQTMRKTLDDQVYGHAETKDEVIRVFAQWISNPQSKGNVIGIHGPMGCGKTSLVKDGICKALNMPFGFIALGGANDGSFLDGHGFTYEGSTYGKIAEILMKSGVMNPIMFFDELDKISSSSRGEEVTNILMHLTDSSQNERFNDKYFGELDLDLSKALMVFSYNDETLVHPILRDRMVTIAVSGYKKKEKIVIARKHLIPSILSTFNIAAADIIISEEIIETIVDRVATEDGVRNLKRGLEAVISWINISRYSADPITFPFTVTRDHVKKCVRACTESNAHLSMYT